jgi:hypothetical protein
MKRNEKEKAIELRKAGLSYREIMEQLPIAKSTLSEWLRSVGLSKRQKQRLTEKKLAAAKRGGQAKHQQRLDRTAAIIEKAKSEIGPLSDREIWLIGITLYWAEGSKEKDYKPGSGMQFTNMDPAMICCFLRWLKNICGIKKEDLIFEIYVHKTHRSRLVEIINFWSQRIGVPSASFSHIYFKKASIKTKRRNIGKSYFGVIKLRVRSSTTLHRKIAGWTQGMIESFR